MLGFPWIPLAESGLFNGLQRKHIKKLPPAELASQVVKIAYKRGAIILYSCFKPRRPIIYLCRTLCHIFLVLSMNEATTQPPRAQSTGRKSYRPRGSASASTRSVSSRFPRVHRAGPV